MSLVTLSLGSNIDPDTHIRLCLDALEDTFGPLQISRIFESEPVGFSDNRNFYNLVVAFDSDWSVGELQAWSKQLEIAHGRTPDMLKCSPRALDIDLLAVGGICGTVDGVALPRGEITHNAFVLQPLAELLPDQYHPIYGLSYAALWQRFELGSQRLWAIDFHWRGRWVSQADSVPKAVSAR
ncbi:2-amino-4-hydroxy-6-hydroxymethyldihydropteridine diphosphokinase [Vreelandella alkaliphila]|uniref:2-amino-4-hydroxy-6-hydroxymethyldihydropteridine diphosphokinase n=1 Tax=Halomonas campaniensis TaxID=213554 RepID=A0A3D0KCH3_9GAMM|nr:MULTISPECIES: 2-amino-4-hydroxy-6-hydroxymethyldihydropteridine diphosphokinase [unclassified Halomonas]ASK20415.1 2-amino-4-hydroxy-6-hydroxymethyldihydropteridine diphosphokinase [Halomonas sp. N3-2A]UTD56013.1 2-amino-4-hydroxy-6-hydroxymethyldihydropteridine diphosphokinase [Halomonas sp. MS1]HBS83878.1 2-amino-4-hydroxy-6-hydroxymethyldihydropteridine diphosphokinase [Halomonas campaniensis]HCA01010.1 2-amino-4-hydroxy-6-hydroxymethyldihydropteridine diphosphokinase [Halomonas campanien